MYSIKVTPLHISYESPTVIQCDTEMGLYFKATLLFFKIIETYFQHGKIECQVSSDETHLYIMWADNESFAEFMRIDVEGDSLTPQQRSAFFRAFTNSET